MIRYLMVAIAGVDRETLKTCPATDKLWAAHLGFALCLSFVVVLGISFHATGYMIPEPWLRGAVALVISLTVFMFDRALYQSDWFYQGVLWQSRADNGGARPARRFLRITIRLAMSFGLAWVIAVFLELAIFSDTITDKIKRDHVTVNQPVYQKIEQYQVEVGAEIEAQRTSLAALEAVYRDELAAAPVAGTPEPAQLDDLAQQIKALDAQESALRADLRQIQESIKTYAADMNAEQLGQRINAANSGRAGAGPRYQFARQQREVYEAQRAAREAEIAELRAKRDDLRTAQVRIATDVAARREQARSAVQGKRDALRVQIERASADLKELEATRLSRVEDFRQKALAASDFQKLKDDPLSRMTAYQELKNDPKDGETITLFSWMTKFLIIFLEIVPVVAKLFFSPPSVYAMRIQAEVERARRRIQHELEVAAAPEVEAAAEPAPEIERRMDEIAATIRETAPHARTPELVQDWIQAMAKNREMSAGQESGLPLVAPVRNERPREKQPEGRIDRGAIADERDLEAEHRREMEPLVSDAMVKQTGTRGSGRRPADPAPRRENKESSQLGLLLQDDIPQKP